MTAAMVMTAMRHATMYVVHRRENHTTVPKSVALPAGSEG